MGQVFERAGLCAGAPGGEDLRKSIFPADLVAQMDCRPEAVCRNVAIRVPKNEPATASPISATTNRVPVVAAGSTFAPAARSDRATAACRAPLVPSKVASIRKSSQRSISSPVASRSSSAWRAAT